MYFYSQRRFPETAVQLIAELTAEDTLGKGAAQFPELFDIRAGRMFSGRLSDRFVADHQIDVFAQHRRFISFGAQLTAAVEGNKSRNR